MRTPMVTRTIQTTHCSILCLDVERGEPFNKEVILPRTYKDDDAILKAAKPMIETGSVKGVHVAAATVNETLYGMSEADFIAYAKELPPRNA